MSLPDTSSLKTLLCPLLSSWCIAAILPLSFRADLTARPWAMTEILSASVTWSPPSPCKSAPSQVGPFKYGSRHQMRFPVLRHSWYLQPCELWHRARDLWEPLSLTFALSQVQVIISAFQSQFRWFIRSLFTRISGSYKVLCIYFCLFSLIVSQKKAQNSKTCPIQTKQYFYFPFVGLIGNTLHGTMFVFQSARPESDRCLHN